MEEIDLLGASESTWMPEGSSISGPASDLIQNNEQVILELSCSAGQPNKRRNHSPPDNVKETYGREGKRIKSLNKSGSVSSSVMVNDAHQLQHFNQETQSLLFSCHPREVASDKILDPGGSRHQISSFKLDEAKHKIFLSHSGAQKDFVEQLCVDLEARGYFFPFLDQRHHSLPKGKDFVPLITEAARLCRVAVIVLSEDFLCSKWPMIELAEFHNAHQAGNQHLNLLPLFYKLSVEDLDEEAIENRWMPIWVQHANEEKRIDVTKWSAAVTALRRANGLIFHKNAMSKVAYRKDVVQHISRLSPPDLLNDSSRNMVGYDRMCQIVSSQFVHDISVGAPVVGLYGTSGLGKSTLCKALCDYFSGQFSGRVCHVELGEAFGMGRFNYHSGNLGEASRMKRQNLMLQKLCGFDKDVSDRITDIGQGLKQLIEHMKRKPVFLAIDNVTNDESARKEAYAYMMAGFHEESRVMVTSRSKAIVQDLLPGYEFCMPMPTLSVNEAGSIFLRSAAPRKSIFMLTEEEQRILGLCIEQCLFESEDGSGSTPQDQTEFLTANHQLSLRRSTYHPLALSALGDFFYRLCGNSTHVMLHWKDHLERNRHLAKDAWRSCPSIMSVIGLQFNVLHPSDQLVFLDIALFTEDLVVWHQLRYHSWIEWLSRLHDETPTVMERRLRDLKRSGMIDWCEETEEDDGFYVYVHTLYKEFSEWYVTEHDVRGLKNAWGVFQASGASLRVCNNDTPPASKYWSDLVRLRIFDSARASARFVASKTMQELHNLVLLQLYLCTDLTALNLEGLDNLRHLELVKLSNLVSVTFTGGSYDRALGIYDSMQNVFFMDLESLTYVPDLRTCTALYSIFFSNCPKVTNFEAVECPHLKELVLIWLVPHQYAGLPNFKSLLSLVFVHIGAQSDVDMFVAEWEITQKSFWALDAQLPHRDPSVHFGMPSFMLLEGLVQHIRQCNHLRFKQAHHYLQPWRECCCTDEYIDFS